MRKLISIALALVMALSLCVTTVWAETTVTTAAELKAAIETGTDTYIKLGADIVIDQTDSAIVKLWKDGGMTEDWNDTYLFCKVDRSLTLDLNGHKISYSQVAYTPDVASDDICFYMFVLVNGANMTVTGNGTIDGSMVAASEGRPLNTICFRLHDNANAELNIKNGTFLTNVPKAKPSDHFTNHNVIYVKNEGGVVTIDGGYFEVKGTSNSIALNLANESTVSANKKIIVNSGTIVGVFQTSDSKPADGAPIANNSDNEKHYIGGDAIANAVNNGEDVTVTTGGEINGVKGGSIKVANGVTGVKINGVPVEAADGTSNDPTTIKVWTVTFMDGETVLSEVGVVEGQKVERPADPTKAGYVFVRWNLNGEEYDFDTAVVANLPLMAEWELAPHEHTRRQPATTTTEVAPETTTTDTVTSAKTFDAGVAVYGVMAVLSVTGGAWVVGKKRG